MKWIVAGIVLISPALGQSLTLTPEDIARQFQKGEELMRSHDFDEAIQAFTGILGTSKATDVVALQRIAVLHRWTRHYAAAREALGAALERDPENQSVMSDLGALQRQRGVQLAVGYGGSDIDYTRNVWSLSAAYGGIDWLDVDAGTSRTDKEVYQRSNLGLNAYMFPTYRLSVRLSVQEKHYTYPISPLASPDDNAYGRVPDYQCELGYHYDTENYASAEIEYFTPHFYWDNTLQAYNHKIALTIRNTIAGPVYGKVFAAVLHDPDPSSFRMEPATRVISSFAYARQTLVGGALGASLTQWDGEITFPPDRDLDRSLAWSLIGQVRFDAGSVVLRYDGLYDRYPRARPGHFVAAQAHMLTASIEPLPALVVTAGMKLLVREAAFVVPLISAHVKTGL